VSVTFYLEDTNLITKGEASTLAVLRLLVGNVNGKMVGAVMPSVEFEIPEIPATGGPKIVTIEGIAYQAGSGNDGLFLGESNHLVRLARRSDPAAAPPPIFAKEEPRAMSYDSVREETVRPLCVKGNDTAPTPVEFDLCAVGGSVEGAPQVDHLATSGLSDVGSGPRASSDRSSPRSRPAPASSPKASSGCAA
jgi:hypothetical protein